MYLTLKNYFNYILLKINLVSLIAIFLIHARISF